MNLFGVFFCLLVFIPASESYLIYQFYSPNDTLCEKGIERTKNFLEQTNTDRDKPIYDDEGSKEVFSDKCYKYKGGNSHMYRCRDGYVEQTVGSVCASPFVKDFDYVGSRMECTNDCTKYLGSLSEPYHSCFCGGMKVMDDLMVSAIVLSAVPLGWFGCCCMLWLVYLIYVCIYGCNC